MYEQHCVDLPRRACKIRLQIVCTVRCATSTHYIHCFSLCRADRPWLSGKKGNARRSSLQLTAFVAVRFSMRIAHGSLGKKATLTAFIPPASPTVGDLRIFPSFSWSGKCDSSGGKPQRLHSNRLPPACCPFCQADRHRLSGQNGNGLKSCGSHMGLSAICFANRDKSPNEASRSDEGALRISVFQQ